MAITYDKLDAHIGTSMTEGVFDTRRRRAVRQHFISGLSGNRGDLIQAINGLKSRNDVISHPDTGQLASHIQARYIKDGSVVAFTHYDPNVANPLAGFNNFDLYTGKLSVPWYHLARTVSDFDPQGRPSGDPENYAGLPRIYPLNINTWTLVSRTILDYNPAGIIGPAYNSDPIVINNNDVTWGGYTIPSQTMRFDKAIILYRGGEYRVTYQFTLRPDTWVREYLTDAGTPATAFSGKPVSFTSPGFPEGIG